MVNQGTPRSLEPSFITCGFQQRGQRELKARWNPFVQRLWAGVTEGRSTARGWPKDGAVFNCYWKDGYIVIVSVGFQLLFVDGRFSTVP